MTIQYLDDGDIAAFDGLSFRRDERTGYYLNAKTHKRLHVYVWEYYNGVVPDGYHVHHKDKNKRNNSIENLELMTAQEHAKLHGRMIGEAQKALMRENLINNAMPKAAAWHGTEEGIEWHKKHYEQNKDALHRKKDYVCEVCGKVFVADDKVSVRYCSNNCKSKARRMSGVDDEPRECVVCGREFRVNKYAKTKTCSNECKQWLRKSGKDRAHTES